MISRPAAAAAESVISVIDAVRWLESQMRQSYDS
jgi:hypothetical protein